MTAQHHGDSMNILKFILLVSVLVQLPSALASKYKRENETCFPVSTIKYEMGVKSFGAGLSQEEFNQVIENAQTVLSSEVKEKLNKKLIIEKNWADGTVDAYATRDDDNNAVIVMNGGLARHPLMTKDGFLLLICHELGHHLGGAPKIPRGNSGLRGWSSAEGQADYFATSKCLPLFFRSGVDIKTFDIDQDSGDYKTALSKCQDNACARVVLAGLSVSRVFASLMQGNPTPELNSSDSSKVGKTVYNHPRPQCRLDTYMSGALCDLGPELPFDSVDIKKGACLKDKGARPGCWFSEVNY